jgi:hypothetical protein
MGSASHCRGKFGHGSDSIHWLLYSCNNELNLKCFSSDSQVNKTHNLYTSSRHP